MPTVNTSENEGINIAESTTVTQAETEVAKVFTQDEVNRLVSGRLTEERTRSQAKFDIELTTKLEAAKADLQAGIDTEVSTKVQAKLNEQALTVAKQKAIADYGLTDDQASRLQGGTADELLADAEKVFGALNVRKPPVLNPGNGGDSTTPVRLEDMSGKDVIKNWDSLFRQHTKGK